VERGTAFCSLLVDSRRQEALCSLVLALRGPLGYPGLPGSENGLAGSSPQRVRAEEPRRTASEHGQGIVWGESVSGWGWGPIGQVWFR
jgi:hypothetical protein